MRKLARIFVMLTALMLFGAEPAFADNPGFGRDASGISVTVGQPGGPGAYAEAGGAAGSSASTSRKPCPLTVTLAMRVKRGNGMHTCVATASISGWGISGFLQLNPRSRRLYSPRPPGATCACCRLVSRPALTLPPTRS